LQLGDFGVRVDEDFFKWGGDGEDRWLTGGGTATYKINKDLSLAAGLGMITGDANENKYDRIEGGYKGNGFYKSKLETPRAYRDGAAYGGVIYKGNASFVGINSEKVLHSVQNWIHRNVTETTPYFYDFGYKSKAWSYFGYYSTNSLIY
jgi:hypothetical protein